MPNWKRWCSTGKLIMYEKLCMFVYNLMAKSSWNSQASLNRLNFSGISVKHTIFVCSSFREFCDLSWKSTTALARRWNNNRWRWFQIPVSARRNAKLFHSAWMPMHPTAAENLLQLLPGIATTRQLHLKLPCGRLNRISGCNQWHAPLPAILCSGPPNIAKCRIV